MDSLAAADPPYKPGHVQHRAGVDGLDLPASAIMLLAVVVLTAVTGAPTAVIFFKSRPFHLSTTAVLLLAASVT